MNAGSKNRIKSTIFLAFVLMLAGGCKTPADKAEKPAPSTSEEDEGDTKTGLTPEQAAKVVAKVGEETITVGDITEQINRLSPYIRRRWSAPEKRKEFLDNLIRVELLSQEAENQGLGKDSAEIDRVVNQVMIRLMIKNDLEKEIIPSSIEESVLKKTYEEEKDKYQRPPQVRASHIVVKTQAEAEKLIADLEKNKNDNRYFREQAKKLSIDPATKEKGGDLGYFSEDGSKSQEGEKIDQTVAEAAWALKNVGDITETPVQSDTGFHVVKMTNKRPKLDRSFESVKRMIESRLLRQKRKESLDKFVEKLRAKADIQLFEENLEKVEVPGGGPMMPPGESARRPTMSPLVKKDNAQTPKPLPTGPKTKVN